MIKSRESYMNALVDWSWLEDLAGCRISDIDGMTERNGHFLYLEAKPFGKPISKGQHIAFTRRVQDGRSEVLAIWLDSAGTPTFYQMFGGGKWGEITGGWNEVGLIVRDILDDFGRRPYPPAAEALLPA